MSFTVSVSEEKQVFFNSGASEGNRWLVDAVVKAGRMRGKPLKVVTTALEHQSLAKPLWQAHLDGLIELCDEQDLRLADVVFAAAVHNETGRIFDWHNAINSVRSDVILVTDAAQAVGRLRVLPDRIASDPGGSAQGATLGSQLDCSPLRSLFRCFLAMSTQSFSDCSVDARSMYRSHCSMAFFTSTFS